MAKKPNHILEAQAKQDALRRERNSIFHDGCHLGVFTPSMTFKNGVKKVWVFLLRGKLTYKGCWELEVKNDGTVDTPDLLKRIQEGSPGQVIVKTLPTKTT